MLNDNRVIKGAFQDVEAYENGANGGTSTGDQFLFTGCESCYLIRANSHDAQRRGFNFGQINATWNMFLLIRDSEFTYNGRTTDPKTNIPNNFRTFVYKSGPCWSGADTQTDTPPYQFGVMERSIIRYNREAGGPCAYGQGWAAVWNSVWWNNGHDTSLYGPADIAVADGVDVKYFGVFNSIVQKRSAITWTHKAPSGFGNKQCPVSNYNLSSP